MIKIWFKVIQHDFRSENCVLPIVMALAKITAERTNTMIDALLRNVTIFLTRNCPQKPAKIETLVRYNAAKDTEVKHEP